MYKIIISSCFLFFTSYLHAETFYISPDGSNWSNGKKTSSPFASFKYAFSEMEKGDELILLDGDYSEEKGTGVLSESGLYGEQYKYSSAIISGLSKQKPTIIRALNPGKATIHSVKSVEEGHGEPLQVGTKQNKVKYVVIKDIIFNGGGSLANTSYVTIKNCGFNGGFGIGDSSHYEGNTYNLIEDVWIWANNVRTPASNYRSNYNVWRRVLIKSDGCDFPGCAGENGKPDPSPGVTVYDSHHVSMQNVIVIDKMLRSAIGYADFSTAQHTDKNASFLPGGISGEDYFLSNNEWLGCMSINSEDDAFTIEADNVLHNSRTSYIKDFLAVNSNGGIAISNTPYNYNKTSTTTIENISLFLRKNSKGFGIYISPELGDTITLHNLLITNANTGIQSPSKASYSNIYTPTGKMFHKYSSCGKECDNTDPFSSFFKIRKQSTKYPLLIEKGSPLHKSGYKKANVGATILYQYGVDGSHYGDKGYNKLSKQNLWPWKNEDRILKDICEKSSYGICESHYRDLRNKPYTITTYIWEQFGNKTPDKYIKK
jgi:hypothetical protein